MSGNGVVGIGRYGIVPLVDGLFEVKGAYLTHLDGADALQSAVTAFETISPFVDINCFLLKGPDGPFLIDSGVGNAWGPAFGQARQAMRERGFAPSDIRRVLLTHAHGDHALGLLNDDGTAYFPNAQICIPEAELAFFSDPSLKTGLADAHHGNFDVIPALRAAYGERIRPVRNGPVLDDIEAIPLPGHTPGHTGYRLTSGQTSVLVLGDALHLDALQLADPRIGVVFDIDSPASAATRLAILERAADEHWLFTGGHLTGFRRIVRDGDVFAQAGL